MLSAARAFISLHLHAPLPGVDSPPRCAEVLTSHPPSSQGQFMQDLANGLRRISLLRCWVNKGDRLDPAPHSCFVAQVLFAELPLQVALLLLDDPTLDHQQRYRQKKGGPQRVRQAGDARLDQRHGQVTGVAGVTKGSFRGYALDRLVGTGRRVGLAHGPLEPAKEQHPAPVLRTEHHPNVDGGNRSKEGCQRSLLDSSVFHHQLVASNLRSQRRRKCDD
jgi:hypothetical protein